MQRWGATHRNIILQYGDLTHTHTHTLMKRVILSFCEQWAKHLPHPPISQRKAESRLGIDRWCLQSPHSTLEPGGNKGKRKTWSGRVTFF